MKIKNILASMALASTALTLSNITHAQSCAPDDLRGLDYRIVFFDDSGNRLKAYKVSDSNINIDTRESLLDINVLPSDLNGFKKIKNEVASFTVVSQQKVGIELGVEFGYEYDRGVRIDGDLIPFVNHQLNFETRRPGVPVRATKTIDPKHVKSLSSFFVKLGCA